MQNELMAGYKDILDYYRESGESVPDELCDLAFDYRYDVSALFNAFDFLNASKFAERIGVVNGFVQEGDTQKESFIPAFDGSGI